MIQTVLRTVQYLVLVMRNALNIAPSQRCAGHRFFTPPWDPLGESWEPVPPILVKIFLPVSPVPPVLFELILLLKISSFSITYFI